MSEEPIAAWSANPVKGSTEQPLADVLPLVYEELRSVAYQFLRRERGDHTLQPTALVHEAFMRLAAQRQDGWESRSAFVAAAAGMIRRVLVDHARTRAAAKRGGGRQRVPLDEESGHPETDGERAGDDELVALDEALTRLAAFDERKSRIIELRFFGGLSEEETAGMMQMSARTVRREWRLARAWLRRELGGTVDGDA